MGKMNAIMFLATLPSPTFLYILDVLPNFFFPIQANYIIKKMLGEVRGLVGEKKAKNYVIVSQEKVLQDTSDRLQLVEKDLEVSQQQLLNKDEEVSIT